MRLSNGLAGGGEAGAQFSRLQCFGLAAPLQDQAFCLEQVGELEAEFQATVGQV